MLFLFTVRLLNLLTLFNIGHFFSGTPPWLIRSNTLQSWTRLLVSSISVLVFHLVLRVMMEPSTTLPCIKILYVLSWNPYNSHRITTNSKSILRTNSLPNSNPKSSSGPFVFLLLILLLLPLSPKPRI